MNRSEQPAGSPNDSWAEPVWPEEQETPTKADRKRWAARDAWLPTVTAAIGENKKRDWIAQAERERRCPLCGGSDPTRCVEEQSCHHQIQANMRRDH